MQVWLSFCIPAACYFRTFCSFYRLLVSLLMWSLKLSLLSSITTKYSTAFLNSTVISKTWILGGSDAWVLWLNTMHSVLFALIFDYESSRKLSNFLVCLPIYSSAFVFFHEWLEIAVSSANRASFVFVLVLPAKYWVEYRALWYTCDFRFFVE